MIFNLSKHRRINYKKSIQFFQQGFCIGPDAAEMDTVLFGNNARDGFSVQTVAVELDHFRCGGVDGEHLDEISGLRVLQCYDIASGQRLHLNLILHLFSPDKSSTSSGG